MVSLEMEFLLLGWGLVGAIAVNALCSQRKRPDGREPVDFWRALEVFGLWAAAGVGLIAIIVSSHNSRDQLTAMNGQLSAMQEEGRAWVGLVGANLVDGTSPKEPLKAKLLYSNFGRQPATNVGNYYESTFATINNGENNDNYSELPFWKDADKFNTKMACDKATESSNKLTLFPSHIDYYIEAGAKEGASITVNDKPASASDAADLINAKRILYVIYGCFAYVTHNTVELTNWCVMIGQIKENEQFAFCPYGNYPTEEKRQSVSD